jgi:hypothetical protein
MKVVVLLLCLLAFFAAISTAQDIEIPSETVFIPAASPKAAVDGTVGSLQQHAAVPTVSSVSAEDETIPVRAPAVMNVQDIASSDIEVEWMGSGDISADGSAAPGQDHVGVAAAADSTAPVDGSSSQVSVSVISANGKKQQGGSIQGSSSKIQSSKGLTARLQNDLDTDISIEEVDLQDAKSSQKGSKAKSKHLASELLPGTGLSYTERAKHAMVPGGGGNLQQQSHGCALGSK